LKDEFFCILLNEKFSCKIKRVLKDKYFVNERKEKNGKKILFAEAQSQEQSVDLNVYTPCHGCKPSQM
jgi:hypothetical protein